MKKIFHTLIPAVMMLLTGCSTEIEEQVPSGNEEGMVHTVTMRLDGEIQHFDDDTRSVSSDWDNNAKLYIQYQTSSGKVSGVATYNKSSDEWTVSYYGSITSNVKTACEVYYFENPSYTNVSSVGLNARKPVYFDTQASYLYKEGVVYLKTLLRPKTGRIRFHGTPGYKFTFAGLKCFTEYNISENRILSETIAQNITVGNDGYTPYIYATFVDDTNCQITVYDAETDYYYQRSFDNNSVLTPTKSGYIDVPTLQSRNGWTIQELSPLCPDNNHPHKIDMGNGLKWACHNLGNDEPGAGGYCYAWGETSNKYKFNDENYKYYKYVNSYEDWIYTKYYNDDPDYGKVDNKTELELSDDAARAAWGGTWRMPTHDEFISLINGCTWILTQRNRFYGYRVLAPNGNTIFLPFAGIYEYDWSEDDSDGNTLKYSREMGLYWSSTLETEESGCECAYCLYISDTDENVCVSNNDYDNYRWNGLTIRPVCK